MLLEHPYVLELVVEQRLADLGEYAMERAVLRSMRSRRRPLRALLGMTLVRLGRWLTGLRASGRSFFHQPALRRAADRTRPRTLT